MGRTLDALMGRRASKTSKLKALLSLTISRLAILRNQRDIRCSHASDDIAVLLHHGHHERAILRAEYVIKEQNMVDVFMMVESYCNLLMERSILLEQNHRECPKELKEAISSLIFMASRSGELPELQDVRSIFTSWYGYEFAAAAIELRSGCAVNTKIMQKMSTKQPDIESKLKVVKGIASEKGLPFNYEDTSPQPPQPLVIPTKVEEETPKQSTSKDPSPTPHPVSPTITHNASDLHENKYLSNSMGPKDRFPDAMSAAQAAFESAAYAAVAARAAVELSRSKSHGKGSHDNTKQHVGNQSTAKRSDLDELHHIQTTGSDSEMEEPTEQGTNGNAIDHRRSPGKEVVVSDASEKGSIGSEWDLKRSRGEGENKIHQKPHSVRKRRGGFQ